MKENKATILLVDDDVDFLMQQQILLKTAGYATFTASSQAEAEELLKERKPDLAVIDLMMENMDGGFALCYHIKKSDSSIPVIIVTAVASEANIEFDASTDEERSWIKADAIMAKPVRFEQLCAEIEHLLKTRTE